MIDRIQVPDSVKASNNMFSLSSVVQKLELREIVRVDHDSDYITTSVTFFLFGPEKHDFFFVLEHLTSVYRLYCPTHSHKSNYPINNIYPLLLYYLWSNLLIQRNINTPLYRYTTWYKFQQSNAINVLFSCHLHSHLICYIYVYTKTTNFIAQFMITTNKIFMIGFCCFPIYYQ